MPCDRRRAQATGRSERCSVDADSTPPGQIEQRLDSRPNRSEPWLAPVPASAAEFSIPSRSRNSCMARTPAASMTSRLCAATAVDLGHMSGAGRLEDDRCHRVGHDVVQLARQGQPFVLEGERCFGGELLLTPARRLRDSPTPPTGPHAMPKMTHHIKPISTASVGSAPRMARHHAC